MDSELNGNEEEFLSQWTYGANGQQPSGAYDWGYNNFNTQDNWVEIANVNIAHFPTAFGNLENTIARSTMNFITWNGSVSSDWNNSSNWTPNSVPDKNSYVVIPNRFSVNYAPILPDSTNIQKILLKEGSELYSGTNSKLYINGNVGTWINDHGNFFPSTGKVYFTNTICNIAGKTYFHDLIIPDSTVLWLTNGAYIGISGELQNYGAFRTVISGETTLEYNGTQNQNIVLPNSSTARYYNLLVSGSGTKTLPSIDLDIIGNLLVKGNAVLVSAANLNIYGNFIIDSAANFDAGNYTYRIYKDLIVNGDITNANNSKFYFVGDTLQNIIGDSIVTLDDIFIDNYSGVNLFTNLNIRKNLNLVNGMFNLNGVSVKFCDNIIRNLGKLHTCTTCNLEFCGQETQTVQNQYFDGQPLIGVLKINNNNGVVFQNLNFSIIDSLILKNGKFNISGSSITFDGYISRQNGYLKTNNQTNLIINENLSALNFENNVFDSTVNPVNNLIIKRAAGVNLGNQSIEVHNKLVLNDGIVNVPEGTYIVIKNGASVGTCIENNIPGSKESYINGCMIKEGKTEFTFPLGSKDYYAPLSISADDTGSDENLFTACYHYENPCYLYDCESKDNELVQVSYNEYWTLNRTGTNSVNVKLTYDIERSGIIGDINDLVVVHWNGSLWENKGNELVFGDSINGVVQSQLMSSFSPVTIGTKSNKNILPVDLVRYYITCDNNYNTLKWSTSSQKNSNYFEIEFSDNLSSWEPLAKIYTEPNVNAVSNYYYTDIIKNNTDGYYRIKHIDLDGKCEIYPVLKSRCFNSQENICSIYPNPASNFIMVEVPNLQFNLKYKITDATGRLLLEGNINDYRQVIEIEKLSSGLYWIHIDGIVKKHKFIKTN